jgi:hypothetical protein
VAWLVNRGFSAEDETSALEAVIARTVRNFSIPRRAKLEKNSLIGTPENVEKARNYYDERCLNCHGQIDAGQPAIGQNFYPKAPNLALPGTQHLSDGEIHYINVVRDPREHPEAITPNLATNNVSPKFTKDQVAFVYGSIWKQRYFTKIGDDYFPEPAQWGLTAKQWRP